jgi:hypothetical protein
VTPNAAVSLLATTYDPATDVYSLYNDEVTTNIRGLWPKGWTGAGVDVVLIDSGVTPVAGLSGTGRSSTGRT